MKTSLYGREHELGWLHNRVFRVPERQNLPSLALIYGQPGIGKTTLLDAFVQASLMRQKAPTVFFQPETAAGIFGVEMFAESMFRSVSACPASWAMAVARLGDQFSQRLGALRRGEAPAAAAYSSQGTITPGNINEMAVAGDPRGFQLSELCVETLSAMVEQMASETGGSFQALSIVLCFDQFADYAPSVKKWIGSVFVQAMMRSERLPVPRVLLTGREPMESAGQTDYWEVPLGRVDEYELRAISRSACIKWLVDAKIEPDLIDEMMERTKGVPGRIAELVEDRKTILAMETEVAREEQSSAVSVRQRRWLHAAAVLEYVDRESLAVLLGEKEAALALEWLRQKTGTEGITLVERAGPAQIFLGAALKRKVLAECASRYPDRHKDFQTKITVQKRLLEKVPSSLHREYLKRLIPIEPFDLDMIDKIYGEHE